MLNKKKATNRCGIADALSVLGDKWTLLIARDILMGNENFESIQNNLRISRNLLTERLKAMVSNKIIKKHVPIDKKRAKYLPTERCNDLMKIFLSLHLWSNKWMPDSKRPEIIGVIDKETIALGLKVVPIETTHKLNQKVKLSLSTIK